MCFFCMTGLPEGHTDRGSKQHAGPGSCFSPDEVPAGRRPMDSAMFESMVPGRCWPGSEVCLAIALGVACHLCVHQLHHHLLHLLGLQSLQSLPWHCRSVTEQSQLGLCKQENYIEPSPCSDGDGTLQHNTKRPNPEQGTWKRNIEQGLQQHILPAYQACKFHK